ncbi:MAG: MAPEG family protein [Steroidobacteraceae bacterium]
MNAGDTGGGPSGWLRARRATIAIVTSGAITWAIVVACAWVAWPEPSVPPAGRIDYALTLCAVPALVTLAMICACFRLFDTVGAEDPRLGAESERFRTNQRVLTNTVEQSWVFVPLVLALSVRLPAGEFRLLPISVAVWCAGRIMFWIGYHVSPRWRGPGFDWTICTSALLAGWFVSTLF